MNRFVQFWVIIDFCVIFCKAGLASLSVIVGRYASGLEAYISVSILIIVHFDPGPSNRICKLLITVCLVILCIVVFLILWREFSKVDSFPTSLIFGMFGPGPSSTIFTLCYTVGLRFLSSVVSEKLWREVEYPHTFLLGFYDLIDIWRAVLNVHCVRCSLLISCILLSFFEVVLTCIDLICLYQFHSR